MKSILVELFNILIAIHEITFEFKLDKFISWYIELNSVVLSAVKSVSLHIPYTTVSPKKDPRHF